MILVSVGSANPVKIKAAESAFKKAFPGKTIKVKGAEITSAVSKQPMSDLESIKGATHRAKKSMKTLNADYGVGIEGGLQKIGNNWFDSGWTVVINKKGIIGIGSSIKMLTPSKMIKMINKGLELGEVDDILFNTKNSKQKQGHFGLMTNNLINREKAYTDGILSALSRFIHEEVF